MTTKPTHATKPSDRIHARDGGIGRSPTEEAIIEYLDEQAASANPAASPSGEVAAPSPVEPLDDAPGPIREPDRYQEAIASRFAAGESLASLADDYDLRGDLVQRAIRVTLAYLFDQHVKLTALPEQAPRPHPDRCKCDGLYVGGICTRCGLPWSPEQAPQAEATPPEPTPCANCGNPGKAHCPGGPRRLYSYYDGLYCDDCMPAKREAREHPEPPDDVIRAAEGVTLEPGEYEVVEIAARDEDPGLTIGQRFTLRYSLEPLSRTGEHIWGTRHTLLTAVRRVAPESAAKPPAGLYVPKPGERVQIVETNPRWPSASLRVGDVVVVGIGTQPGLDDRTGWLALWPMDGGAAICRVVPAPLTEPEPVPAEPRDDFQIIHTALHDDEGLTFAGPALERIRKERDELSSKVSELELTVYRRDRELEDARGEWRKQETRLVESNAELRSKVSELESENAELSRKNIDLFDEKEKTRATLTATEAKLAEAGKARRAPAELFGMVHEPDTGPTWPANWEALLDRDRELSTRDAELARVRGELAAPPFAAYDWALGELTRHMANELHESAYVSAIACVAAVRVKLGVPAETPAVAAPAVVQREIMVGSTWADTQGIYADGEVTSYNPQLPDTIRITGASSWSEPVFRCRWRHVSDPPTKESAGKRKS